MKTKIYFYEGCSEFYCKQKYTGLSLYSMDGVKLPGKFSRFAYQLPVDHPLSMPTLHYWNECLEGYGDFNLQPSVLGQALMDSSVR